MKSNKKSRMEYEIEKTIDSIISKKMRGVEKTLNRIILDSLNKFHAIRVDEFSNKVIPQGMDSFGLSFSQKFDELASLVNKSILRDF
jgi:hypothetical protein